MQVLCWVEDGAGAPGPVGPSAGERWCPGLDSAALPDVLPASWLRLLCSIAWAAFIFTLHGHLPEWHICLLKGTLLAHPFAGGQKCHPGAGPLGVRSIHFSGLCL